MLQLALRNLLRNGRRTLLAMLSVSLGLMLAVVARDLNHGVWTMMISAAITGTAGHVVVQAPSWQDEHDPMFTVPDSTALAAALQRSYPEAVVTRRVMVPGLLTSPRGSAAIGLAGVVVEEEAKLTLLNERMERGAWLTEGDAGVLIGWRLADALQVDVGDKVVFMAQVGTGEVESLLYRVRGVFRTGAEQLDAFTATAPLSTVQRLLPGEDPAHQVAVVFPSLGSEHVDLAPARAVTPPGLAVLSWSEALPALAEQMSLDAKMNGRMYSLLGMIIAVGVLNTVLMGAMERIREFGVLLSLGMRPLRLAALIMVEGLLLGVGGAVVGLVAGAVLFRPLYTHGIDLGELVADNAPIASPIDTVIYAVTDVQGLVTQTAIAVLMALLASVYPAWMAMRLQPVEAMRGS